MDQKKKQLGGYWSIIIASIPFGMIILYREGQKRLFDELRPMRLSTFLVGFREIYLKLNKIKGSALFFAKDPKLISPYIAHTMINNNIIYEDKIIVSIGVVTHVKM